ncbi:hypothetical protein JM946_09765 [Steroidobacter sp. S1-65]|uniref:Uncharacterized protein n=1 Tax=Steroidobacter gossypii TaxID=2805490 RepID=A0ABS1WVN9_9GAMM|nr:hypothetical protein [Steroidobacter gossypii]MBM0105037.1 hypothetical protein [Steroidobacter gossypii]
MSTRCLRVASYPDLYLDIHVTDGVDHVHDITFSFPGWGGRNARSPAGGEWLDKVFRPEVERALEANGHLPAPYISAIDARAPEKGIRMRPGRARTSTGYGDLRRLPTVFVENHSLKPYRQRVLGTYVLIEQALKTTAKHGAKLLQVGPCASMLASSMKAKPDLRPAPKRRMSRR